jgi:tRNA threonylcarbamoyl adenosine modification protein YeaZ
MKPSLLIETATERGIVSIMDGEKSLFHVDLPYGLNSSKFMLSAIRQGLNELNINAKDLSLVAVGIGPGSFTGIRVAAATAQSIAYASGIPVIGVSTLACFAPSVDGKYAVIIDAKIGGVYMLTATMQSGDIIGSSEPVVLPLAELTQAIDGLGCIVTPNSQIIRPKFETIYGSAIAWEESAPNSQLMSRLAQAKIQSGAGDTQNTLDLQYLRKSQAENNR